MPKLKTVKSYLELFEKEHTCKSIYDIAWEYVHTLDDPELKSLLLYPEYSILLGMNILGCPIVYYWAVKESRFCGLGGWNLKDVYGMQDSGRDLGVKWYGKKYTIKNGGYITR